MKTLVFATGNAGKLKELEALLGDGWQVKSAKDFPEIAEVVVAAHEAAVQVGLRYVEERAGSPAPAAAAGLVSVRTG